MPNAKWKLLTSGLVLIWLTAVAGVYFVYHKPFSPATALRLGRAAFDVFIALGIVSLAGALGQRLLSGRWPEPGEELGAAGKDRLAFSNPEITGGQVKHPLARAVAEALLGLGVLSIIILTLGATLTVSRPAAWGLFLLLGLVLRRNLRAWWGGWRGLPILIQESGRIGRLGVFGAGLIMLFTLLVALAPPVKFDSLVYHFALPARYIEAGRVVYVPENIFWGMPQSAEMLYTWAAALASVQSAAALSWLFGVLGMVGLAGLAADSFGGRYGWVAPVTVLSGFSTAIMLSWGYVDWPALSFGWASLLWLFYWRRHAAPFFLVLAGVMAGMALSTKYTAGLLLVAGSGVIVWDRRTALRLAARGVGLFGASALAVSIPWWVKNLVATGSPFYPLLIPAGSVDPIRLAFYQEHAAWGSWLDAVFLPLRATILGIEASPGFGVSAGPLLLGLGGVAWLGLKARPTHEQLLIGTAGITALLGLSGWAIAGRVSGLLISSRLYLALFPAFGVLAVAGFKGIAGLRMSTVRLERVTGILLLFIFGLNVFQVAEAVHRTGAVRFLLGEISEEQYLADNLGWYALAMESIRELPRPANVLMLWEARGYYCQPVCEPDEVLDRWVHQMRTQASPESILNSWRAEGYTHLLYYRAGAEFIRMDDPRYHPEEWTALESLFTSLPEPVDFGGTYELYPLQP